VKKYLFYTLHAALIFLFCLMPLLNLESVQGRYTPSTGTLEFPPLRGDLQLLMKLLITGLLMKWQSRCHSNRLWKRHKKTPGAERPGFHI